MEINDRVKGIRQEISLNQQEFADRIGLTQGQISRIEKGGNIVTEQNIKAICTTFNVREEWLREGKGEMFLSNLETLIRRLKDELHLNDTEIAILNIYAELPQEDRDSIIGFAKKASALFSPSPVAPPAEEPKAPPLPEEEFSLSPLPVPTPEDYLAYERVRNFYRRRRPDHATTYEERRAMVEAEMEAERKAAETSAASTLGGSTA